MAYPIAMNVCCDVYVELPDLRKNFSASQHGSRRRSSVYDDTEKLAGATICDRIINHTRLTGLDCVNAFYVGSFVFYAQKILFSAVLCNANGLENSVRTELLIWIILKIPFIQITMCTPRAILTKYFSVIA